MYNKDVRITAKDGKITKGGATAIGKTFQAGDMVAVQAKSSYLPEDYDDYARVETKTPEMSMDITLPGRHVIYCGLMNSNRLSQRIRDKKLRKSIENMMDELTDIRGVILRASAANTQTDVLMREAKILKTMWSQISAEFKGSEAQLIALGPDAIQRTLSDQGSSLIDRIEVVTMDHFTAVEEWCEIFAPELVTKVEPIELDDASDDLALFHYRDIIGQIEDLSSTYAILPHGGNIIIQGMAALAAVDVNKGGDKRSNLAVNIEAAAEIARQIRLRNCGGIIVIDFLKFKGKKEETETLAALEKAIAADPCTVQIHGVTKLGLVEITRKRRTPTLQDRLKGVEVPG